MSDEALDCSELPVKMHTLDLVPLDEIAAVFQKKLAHNFHSVSAEVIDCPDLTKEPYSLAAKGLGGNPVIIQLGGLSYLMPLVNRQKCYDLNTVPKLVRDDECFIIGAGAGPWPYKGRNCEGIFNVVVSQNKVTEPGTRIVIVDEQSEKCKLEMVPASENRCCLSADIFSSRGETSKVVKVHCKKRIGELDFITSMRAALEEAFPDKLIGEFLVSGLNLRLQHFHSFGKTEGGHYQCDTTPEDVEYLAILATGCTLAQVD